MSGRNMTAEASAIWDYWRRSEREAARPEVLEEVAREAEEVAGHYGAADVQHHARSGHYHPTYGAVAEALTRFAERIRALKGEKR